MWITKGVSEIVHFCIIAEMHTEVMFTLTSNSKANRSAYGGTRGMTLVIPFDSILYPFVGVQRESNSHGRLHRAELYH